MLAPQQQQQLTSDSKALYVGNLDPRVTDLMLHDIFSTVGRVDNVKIIPDKNFTHGGLNYGFVEYVDHRSAEQALNTLGGRKIFNSEIKVNWAFQGQQHKEDTTNHYHIFVGDLSPEVNDETLGKAFSAFGSMSDARVMWDVNSGKSRGYGFVAFRDKTDAEQAIATMNGEWLGSRAIRCNWANQKVQSAAQGSQQMTMSYEAVVAQTPAYNSTVYVGNLTPNTTQQDLIPTFQQFGYIHEVRLQADRGFAFVKLDTHENAAMSIVQLQGYNINGRPAKLSWGKDRDPGQQQNHWTQQSFYPQQGYYQQSHQQPYYQQPAHHTYGPAPTSEYDLPPGMSAPPPTLASLDSQPGAGAATPGPGSQGWDQYYSYYYQGSPSHYHQGATGTPGSHHAQTPNGY